jgi:hypothetical protein
MCTERNSSNEKGFSKRLHLNKKQYDFIHNLFRRHFLQLACLYRIDAGAIRRDGVGQGVSILQLPRLAVQNKSGHLCGVKVRTVQAPGLDAGDRKSRNYFHSEQCDTGSA